MTCGAMKATARRLSPALRAVASLAVASSLAACAATDALAPVTDQTSAAAPSVEAALAQVDGYPRWREFPADPRNVPTTADIRARVEGVEADQAVLEQQVAGIGWTLDRLDLEPWAQAARARLDPRLARAATPEQFREIEPWAAALRERAEAPPPVDNHTAD